MTTQPLLNPTPKARFQESGDNIGKHRDMVDSNTFQRACDFAMLEYGRILHEQATDANSSIPVALRLRGAHEFLNIFRNLSEKAVQPPTPPPVRNLNHNT